MKHRYINVTRPKKSISGNEPCRASPRKPAVTGQSFPPENGHPAPLATGFNAQTLRFVILPRDSPDSVTSGPGPLMPERQITPPLTVTIPQTESRNKRATASRGQKRRSGTHFSRAVQVCCTRLVRRPARKSSGQTRHRWPDDPAGLSQTTGKQKGRTRR